MYRLLYLSISNSIVPYTHTTLPYRDKPEEKGSPFYIIVTDEYTIYLAPYIDLKMLIWVEKTSNW